AEADAPGADGAAVLLGDEAVGLGVDGDRVVVADREGAGHVAVTEDVVADPQPGVVDGDLDLLAGLPGALRPEDQRRQSVERLAGAQPAPRALRGGGRGDLDAALDGGLG